MKDVKHLKPSTFNNLHFSLGSFLNCVNQFMSFFDHLLTYLWLIFLLNTVKLLKKLAGLITFLWLQMRVLLEIVCFYLLNLRITVGLIGIQVLLGVPLLEDDTLIKNRLHVSNHLPTPFCQRSLRMTACGLY